MAKVIGKLSQVLQPSGDLVPELGTVEFALCGYGSHIPRGNNQTTQFALITQAVEVNSADGTFGVELEGNDVIDPPGTYYTYTVKNANGDTVQTVAYVFQDALEYDLDWGTYPFDPSQGPPNVPPVIIDLLQIVNFDPAATFSGASSLSWQITLTADCSPQFTNLVDGQLYTIIIIQDDAGNHAFNWPSNVKNATWVNPEPDGITIQTFVAYSNTLYPIGAATFYP